MVAGYDWFGPCVCSTCEFPLAHKGCKASEEIKEIRACRACKGFKGSRAYPACKVLTVRIRRGSGRGIGIRKGPEGPCVS